MILRADYTHGTGTHSSYFFIKEEKKDVISYSSPSPECIDFLGPLDLLCDGQQWKYCRVHRGSFFQDEGSDSLVLLPSLRTLQPFSALSQQRQQDVAMQYGSCCFPFSAMLSLWASQYFYLLHLPSAYFHLRTRARGKWRPRTTSSRCTDCDRSQQGPLQRLQNRKREAKCAKLCTVLQPGLKAGNCHLCSAISGLATYRGEKKVENHRIIKIGEDL